MEHIYNQHLIDIIFIVDVFTFCGRKKQMNKKKLALELLSMDKDYCLFRAIFKTMRDIVAGHNVTRANNLTNKTMELIVVVAIALSE